MSEETIGIYIIVSMIFVLILSISLMWFFYHTQNKIIELQLKEQQIKIEFQNDLLTNTIKTQENERKRIAGELHDDVASKLNIMHLNLHLLKKKQPDDPDYPRIIDQLETSLQNSLERTRSISHELMPQVLKKFGFHAALKELCREVNSTGKIHMQTENDDLWTENDDFKVLNMYRIIQELVNNSLKYAEANKILISFGLERGFLVMDYSDDGKGFNPDEQTYGLGISNIKSRSELLKAEWQFLSSTSATGFRFILKFIKDAENQSSNSR
jgi:two-component system, NarL family, sensor kinase